MNTPTKPTSKESKAHQYDVIDITKMRNIGIVAHVDAGKTTVSERVLYYCGKSHKIGEVHSGEATMDYMKEEQERGVTVVSAVTTCLWKDHIINLVDSPGHVDFTMEVERALRVLDSAIVIFDGVSGVEPQTETVWAQADYHKLPRICFINKLDRDGASFYNCKKMIEKVLGVQTVPLYIPMGTEKNFYGLIDLVQMRSLIWEDGVGHGESYTVTEIPSEFTDIAGEYRQILVDTVSQHSEEITEAYFSEQPITVDMLKRTIRQGTIDRLFVPLLCGSAFKNKGVQCLLDAVNDYLPCPTDIPLINAYCPTTNQQITRTRKADAPFIGYVFKIIRRFVGTVTLVRIYAGSIKSGYVAYNTQRKTKIRLGRLVRMHANTCEDIDEASAGEIIGILGLSDVVNGDTLCDMMHQVVLDSLRIPPSVLSQYLYLKSSKDLPKLSKGLEVLQKEDPSFRVASDNVKKSQSGKQDVQRTLVKGMGELHLSIMQSRLKNEFAVEVELGDPLVEYKETITKKVKIDYTHKKQSGGAGQFARVVIEFEPLDINQNFEFENKIREGVISKDYIPSVESALRSSLGSGAFGYPVVGVKATLIDGGQHAVDSSTQAFESAAKEAFRRGIIGDSGQLLEPIMLLWITTPEEYASELEGDIMRKRGELLGGRDYSNPVVVKIKAHIPIAETFKYATTVRSMSQGRASFSLQFSHYSAVPEHIVQNIVK